jgi:hypothetical protein
VNWCPLANGTESDPQLAGPSRVLQEKVPAHRQGPDMHFAATRRAFRRPDRLAQNGHKLKNLAFLTKHCLMRNYFLSRVFF